MVKWRWRDGEDKWARGVGRRGQKAAEGRRSGEKRNACARLSLGSSPQQRKDIAHGELAPAPAHMHAVSSPPLSTARRCSFALACGRGACGAGGGNGGWRKEARAKKGGTQWGVTGDRLSSSLSRRPAPSRSALECATKRDNWACTARAAWEVAGGGKEEKEERAGGFRKEAFARFLRGVKRGIERAQTARRRMLGQPRLRWCAGALEEARQRAGRKKRRRERKQKKGCRQSRSDGNRKGFFSEHARRRLHGTTAGGHKDRAEEHAQQRRDRRRCSRHRKGEKCKKQRGTQ